jgi:hypothetical protein
MIEVVLKIEIHQLRLLCAPEHSLLRYEHFVPLFFIIGDGSPIFRSVIERALVALEAFLLVALQSFVYKWVKLLLLPSV